MTTNESIQLLKYENERLKEELKEVRSDVKDILKLFCIYEDLCESEISSLEEENKKLKSNLGKRKYQ
jgi:CRISPR/Cas system-associated protein Cas7 (RAMP superfamily)